MIKFEKPIFKVAEYVESRNYGKFEIEPLERGFGTTLGNALRRVMLSSLPGDAITSVHIDGVLHEFQTIDGVIEDVTGIILNLKSVVVKNHTNEPKTIKLNVSREGVVTAADIEKDADIEIVNPEQEIATIVKGGKLNMEMTVSSGRGYVRAEANKKLLGDVKLNTIAMDSNFSPIERVNYEVEGARVGQDDSYDKLTMEVWTNGSITPEESVALASRILIEHFNILADLNEIADETGSIRIVLWDDNAQREFEMGQAIKLQNPRFDLDRDNRIDAAVNRSTAILEPNENELERLPSQDELMEAIYVPRPIESLTEDDVNVCVTGTIHDVEADRVIRKRCPACGKTVEETEDEYICDYCGHVFDDPKYLLMVPLRIEDDTGSIKVTFFDNLAEELIGMNKEEIISIVDDGYGIEDKLEDLEGLTIEILANVSFDDYNEENRLNPKKILSKYY